MIKIGDTVRFLNAVGGGIVTRIDEKKSLVYVEDTDGFETPVLERECVLMGTINSETNFPVKDFKSKLNFPVNQTQKIDTESIKTDPQLQATEQVIETPEGDKLKTLLAFFPIDIKQLQTTSYECYFVNDSNYFLYYNLIATENNNWKSIAHGLIEPNMQELMTEISKDNLGLWEHIQVQLIPFKKSKNYNPQPIIDIQLKINTVKFYKLHSFSKNDYFDELSLMIEINTDKETENQKLSEISPEEIKSAMFEKKEQVRPRIIKRSQVAEVIEVDLHINELIDSTSGLTNGDMLQLQLDKFHEILDQNKNRKGQKIVFIHGKGEGVLRNEIEKLLKTRYKDYYFQDASFREYGFGATMVTIK